MTNSGGFHLAFCRLLSAGSAADTGSTLSTIPAELPRNSSEGLVCPWLFYILGNFLVGNVSETRDRFVSFFLSYVPLFDILASISKVALTRARPDTVGVPLQEWLCNSSPQGPSISSFCGSPPFLLCWELFAVNICLLIWKLSVLKIKPKPCIYAQQDFFMS